MKKYLPERYNSIEIFLHISKKEQKKRFIGRIDDPAKNWKFSPVDIAERKFWKDYQKAYEEAISNTSTEYAPGLLFLLTISGLQD